MRIVLRSILPALALCVLGAPSMAAPPKATDKEFTLRPGESAALPWQKGRITYEGVESDLRCHAPAGAACAVDGPVTVRVTIEVGAARKVLLSVIRRGDILYDECKPCADVAGRVIKLLDQDHKSGAARFTFADRCR